MVNTPFLFLKYMIAWLTVVFVRIFLKRRPEDAHDFLNQRTYFPPSLYQTLHCCTSLHLLCHASAREPKLAHRKDRQNITPLPPIPSLVLFPINLGVRRKEGGMRFLLGGNIGGFIFWPLARLRLTEGTNHHPTKDISATAQPPTLHNIL